MVRSINSDGTLALTTLGGPLTPTLDGEYCEVITRDERTILELFYQNLLQSMFIKMPQPKNEILII